MPRTSSVDLNEKKFERQSRLWKNEKETGVSRFIDVFIFIAFSNKCILKQDIGET